jgi:hypothetical protein
MGLGKTRTAITTALMLHRSFSGEIRDEIPHNSLITSPVGPATAGIFMIISPKAVVDAWMKEIEACSKFGCCCYHYSRPPSKERETELFNFLRYNGYTDKEINSNELKHKQDRVVFILDSYAGAANACSLLGKNKANLEARKKMRGMYDYLFIYPSKYIYIKRCFHH